MNQSHPTPQDAEDTYYDALEEGNLEKLLAVWEDSDDIGCLLPMQPLARGRQGIGDLFAQLLGRSQGIGLSVKHLDWIEADTVAIHLVEEAAIGIPGERPPMAVYGVNIYRKDDTGWRLIFHQNSPTPPPPGTGSPMGSAGNMD